MNFFRYIGESLSRFFSHLVPYRLRQTTILGRLRGTLDVAAEKAIEGPKSLWRRFFWFIHIAIVIAIVVGLWYLNSKLELARVLRAPTTWLTNYWLPLLFVIAYSLGWLGFWLWKLLGPERETTDFPDIDEAWREARGALLEANLDPTRLPLFLVLGKAASGNENYFAASQFPWAVRNIPRRVDSPLHVY